VSAAYRARSATELVDGAIQLFRANYAALLTLGAVYYVPILVVQWTLIGTLGPMSTASQVGAVYERLGVVYPALIIWTAAWYTVIFTFVSDVYLGRPGDIGSAMTRGLTRFLPTMMATILKSLGVVVAFIFFAIPGILLMLYWFAALPAAVLEPVGPLAALGRSGTLSRGVKWHVLKTYLLAICLFLAAYVLVLLIGWIISVFLHAVSLPAATRVLTIVISIGMMFVYPLWPIIQTLLYYDARIRNEGYDIELMAQRVGGAPTPAPAI
jgi:hypothetical protein